MIPVLSIVGSSDCGKTTLLENLIRELSGRGYKVGTIKHDVHGFDIDKEGKDTYRHKQAGAHSVLISSPWKYALISDVDSEKPLDEIAGFMPLELDIILTEGFKSADKPKIEIFRKNHSDELLCADNPSLVAVATNDKNNNTLEGIKNILDLDNTKEIADFIEKHYIQKSYGRVSLTVNGEKIKLNQFARDIVESTLKGVISQLKGCENPKDIDIKIKDK